MTESNYRQYRSNTLNKLWYFTGLIVALFVIVFLLIVGPFKTNVNLCLASISGYLLSVAILCMYYKPRELETNPISETTAPSYGQEYYLNLTQTGPGTLDSSKLDSSYNIYTPCNTSNKQLVAQFYTDLFYESSTAEGTWILQQYARVKNDDYKITEGVAQYSFDISTVDSENSFLKQIGESTDESYSIQSTEPTLYFMSANVAKTPISANSKIMVRLYLKCKADVAPTTEIVSLFETNHPSFIKTNYVIEQAFVLYTSAIPATDSLGNVTYQCNETNDACGNIIPPTNVMTMVSEIQENTLMTYELDEYKDLNYVYNSFLFTNSDTVPLLQSGTYTYKGYARVTSYVNVVQLKFAIYIYDGVSKTRKFVAESGYSKNITTQSEQFSMTAIINDEQALNSSDERVMIDVILFNSGANDSASIVIDSNATLSAELDVDYYKNPGNKKKKTVIFQDDKNFETKLAYANMVLLSILVIVFSYFNYKKETPRMVGNWIFQGLFLAATITSLVVYMHTCLTGYSWAMLVNIFAVFILVFVALSVHVFQNPALIGSGAVAGITFLFFVFVGLISWKLLVENALNGTIIVNIIVFILGLVFMLFVAYKMFKSSVTEYLSPANYTLQQIDLAICWVKENIPFFVAKLAENWKALIALTLVITILVHLHDIRHFFVFIWESCVKVWNSFIDLFNFWPMFKRSKLFDFSHLFEFNATIPKIQGTLFKALGAILLGGIMFVLSTVGAWAVGLGVAILAFLSYLGSQIPVPQPDVPDVPDVNMPDNSGAKYFMMALIVVLLAFGASIGGWVVAVLCAVASGLAYLVPNLSPTTKNAVNALVAGLLIVGYFLGGWAVVGAAGVASLLSYGLSYIPELKAWLAMVFNKLLHLFPAKVFFPEKQKLNKETTVDVGKFSYRYAISFWLYLIPQPPNEAPEANQFVNLLSYGRKPAVLYNAANNILRISMLSQDGDNLFVADVRDMKLQAWSNVVLNVDATLIDIFVDGKLYASVSSVPAVGDTTLTVGESRGNRGYIVGIRFLNNNGSSETITADEVRVLYEKNVRNDPPTF